MEAAPVDDGGGDAAELELGVVVGVHALRNGLRALHVAALWLDIGLVQVFCTGTVL